MPRLDIHVYLHFDPTPAGVMAGINTILERMGKMSTQLDDLTREVSEANTVMDSAIVLINGFRDKLDAAIAAGNPEALTALSASLDAKSNELAAAVVANT